MFRLAALPLILLFLAPLAASLAFIAPLFFDHDAFTALFAHPQFAGGLKLSLFTGVSSTLLSLVFAIVIAANSRGNLTAQAGAMLAVPHLALAIGLAFFIVPTGMIARLLALPMGWTTPPQWVAPQDPFGFSLIAALVLKETQFLVYVLASLLNRDDLRQVFSGHMKVARSLGHGQGSVWFRILLPQLLPRMVWPLVAVFSYGLTVVDMALVIGPTQPPTLAQVIWSDLNDAEPAMNARGAAGVLALSAVIVFLLLVVGLLRRLGRPWVSGLYSGYPRSRPLPIVVLGPIWGLWRVFYSVVGILLVLQSVAAYWPFPRLLPETMTLKAWAQLWSDLSPLATSLVLALATAVTALLSVVAWLESQPRSRDRLMLAAASVFLCLPILLIALGQYRLFLLLGITGTGAALFLAHLLPVMAYVLVMLVDPYRAYDGRWRATSSGLGAARATFLLRVKWPMLKAPLLAAFAVGFAVSIAQFVTAQLAAAGRFSTLPMEAVTLSAGGNRPLIATYGLALMALPLVVFLLAGFMAKPRWSTA